MARSAVASRVATMRVSDHAARSSPVTCPAIATEITIALTGQSAENSERPESTPNPATIG